MLQKEPFPPDDQSAIPNINKNKPKLNIDFQQELDELESIILDGVRIPLTDLIVIDELLILDRVDLIRQQIPQEIAIARKILRRQQEILKQAEDYARQLTESAQQQAERIIQESALLRQAELEATRMKIETQQKCQQLREETQAEIEQWQEMAIAQYQEMQNGADGYARNVLANLEEQLSQMLVIIRNGYQELEPETVEDRSNNDNL